MNSLSRIFIHEMNVKRIYTKEIIFKFYSREVINIYNNIRHALKQKFKFNFVSLIAKLISFKSFDAI